MIRLCGDLVVPGGLLLVVMPRACMDNSRYMTQEHFVAIIEAQGFTLLRDKLSTRLAFYVLQQDKSKRQRRGFKKELLREGGGMNNFSIVLEARSSDGEQEEDSGEVEESEVVDERGDEADAKAERDEDADGSGDEDGVDAHHDSVVPALQTVAKAKTKRKRKAAPVDQNVGSNRVATKSIIPKGKKTHRKL
jgi:hypothetical protein